jgi:hypothetical protein
VKRDSLPLSVDDSAFGEVVGADLDEDAVTGSDANVVSSHFSRDQSKEFVLLLTHFHFQTEHGIGEGLLHNGFDFDVITFRHSERVSPKSGQKSSTN